MREMCGDICCSPKVAKTVCGKCAGRFVVFKKWPKTCAGSVRGNLLCFGVAKHVCGKCAGNFAAFKRWQTTCAGNARGILLFSRVAKHVCGKCAGRFGVFKGWQKNECWKCARKFVVTCDSVDELSDHEHLHIVAILAQDECCLIFVTSAALASSQVCRN